MIALIDPHYPKGDGVRPAYPLVAMLRVHLMKNWFGYSDPAMEESLYERRSSASLRGCIWIEFLTKQRSSTFAACWRNMSWRVGFCRLSTVIWVTVD